MILGKTTEYAISILTFMATRDEEVYSSEYLYEQLNIPPKYLRHLLTDLKQKGFIASTRGRLGGFVFSRELKSISLLEIIEVMEGQKAMSTCPLNFTACIVNKPCILHDRWSEAQSKMVETLASTSLGDLRERYCADEPANYEYIR